MQENPTLEVHEVPVTVAKSDIDVLDHVIVGLDAYTSLKGERLGFP